METTNVKPEDLNFNRYSMEQYDRDIVNSIPFHKEIHQLIQEYLSVWVGERHNHTPDVLDVGVGTGLTSKLVKTRCPDANLTVVDFSAQMLKGAKEKLGDKGVTYLLDDYAEVPFGDNRYDLVLSVIGLHHQTDEGKQKMFQKIRRTLRPRGAFIFGDLVTFRDPRKAALAAARHYHHLVEKAHDEQALTEWAHHHMFMNKLAPLEDQIDWLKQAGFNGVSQLFQLFETVLIVAQ